MIQESSVLLRIQHLEQGTSGITVVPTSNLINLIDKDERVLGPNTLQSLDDLSGKGSTIQCSVK